MLTVFMLGSKSDMDHANKIIVELDNWNIPHEIIVASAHKVPEKCMETINKYNQEQEIIYVTIAGRSNALSGIVAANSIHPVIACPPFADKDDYMVNIHSTLQMPSDTPYLTVLDTKNCALCVARIFGLFHLDLQQKLKDHMMEVKKKF